MRVSTEEQAMGVESINESGYSEPTEYGEGRLIFEDFKEHYERTLAGLNDDWYNNQVLTLSKNSDERAMRNVYTPIRVVRQVVVVKDFFIRGADQLLDDALDHFSKSQDLT